MRCIFCLLLCFGLCCVLFACGWTQAEPAVSTTIEITTGEAATAEEETTEEPTTAFVPMGGKSDGAAWRTLDLTDEKNAEIKDWLQTQFNPIPEGRREEEPEQLEFPMGANKIIIKIYEKVYVQEQFAREIYLRTPDGKETLLLKSDDPLVQDDPGVPHVVEILDDRYFLFQWLGYQWSKATCVYDIQEMREIEVDGGLWLWPYLKNKHLYFLGYDSDAPYGGPVALHLADLSLLPDPITPVNLLEGLPHTDGRIHDGQLLSPDEKYYIVTLSGEGDDEIRIFDVENKQFVARFFAPPDTFNNRREAFRDDKTLYLYETDWERRPVDDETNYALRRISIEITLP